MNLNSNVPHVKKVHLIVIMNITPTTVTTVTQSTSTGQNVKSVIKKVLTV